MTFLVWAIKMGKKNILRPLFLRAAFILFYLHPAVYHNFPPATEAYNISSYILVQFFFFFLTLISSLV